LLDELRRSGLGILMITHDLSTAARFADRIAVMYLGRIVEIGPTEAVVSAPQHPYTRALLAAVPRLGGSGVADLPELELGEPPDPHNPPTGCHLHPRCPVGPTVLQDREICVDHDPREGAGERVHFAFCHFAPARSSAGPDPVREEHLHVARDR
jgi:peptide/nickel transport system ATP-binding protein